ncbi:hypothetical protein [Saccharopolyspora sp. 5N708]|uniref:hypothetical protein n=1 Tax=Saccharopolyspora sp. 5N708 TaxID=3457424 RepID=UPI003FD43468
MQRVAAAFGRSSRAPDQTPPAASGFTPDQAPTMVDGYLQLDGARFVPVSQLDEFMAAVGTQRRIALRLSTSQYEEVLTTLIERFDADYENAAPEYRAFRYAELICTGCGWTFPGSYRMSLLGMLSPGRMSGGTPGFEEFGKTGVCTRCRSAESFLAYELFPVAEIDAETVAAMRRHWRADARTWWSATGRSKGICDKCNRDMARDAGFLIGRTRLECVDCTDDHLADALEQLRANPYYFGSAELRHCRPFRTG